MIDFLLELLASAGGGIIRLLFSRWLNKDPEKEALNAALKAKQEDADALAAPPRSDADLDRIVQLHKPH